MRVEELPETLEHSIRESRAERARERNRPFNPNWFATRASSCGADGCSRRSNFALQCRILAAYHSTLKRGAPSLFMTPGICFR